MGLTVKHFTDAFKKTGINPVIGKYCVVEGKKKKTCSGCALTALYFSVHKIKAKDIISFYNSGLVDLTDTDINAIVEEWATYRYGDDFVTDFISGFDYGSENSDYSPAYKLGRKVREAVLNK